MTALEPWIPYLTASAGFLAGATLIWLVARARIHTERTRRIERDRSSKKAIADLEAGSANLEAEVRQLRQTESAMLKRQTELEVLMQAHHRSLEEKHQLLKETEYRMSLSFKALATEALQFSQKQFLQMAQASFASQQKETANTVKARQAAVETLVKPVAASLEKVASRIDDLEKPSRAAAAKKTTRSETPPAAKASKQTAATTKKTSRKSPARKDQAKKPSRSALSDLPVAADPAVATSAKPDDGFEGFTAPLAHQAKAEKASAANLAKGKGTSDAPNEKPDAEGAADDLRAALNQRRKAV